MLLQLNEKKIQNINSNKIHQWTTLVFVKKNQKHEILEVHQHYDTLMHLKVAEHFTYRVFNRPTTANLESDKRKINRRHTDQRNWKGWMRVVVGEKIKLWKIVWVWENVCKKHFNACSIVTIILCLFFYLTKKTIKQKS